jgi:methyltransferase
MSAALLLLVTIQRAVELIHARRNTRFLLAAGGHEIGAGHYPLMVLFHVSWLIALWHAVIADAPGLQPWFAVTYLLLQVFRLWVLASLGRFWTTRVIIPAEIRLVRRGPYRFCRHPNYLLVSLEIAVLPLALGLWRYALVFSVINAALLLWRIHVEEQALAPHRH